MKTFGFNFVGEAVVALMAVKSIFSHSCNMASNIADKEVFYKKGSL